MHLADAFIQSELQCIQAIHLYCQYVCSLGIEPTTFALLTQCSTTEPQLTTCSSLLVCHAKLHRPQCPAGAGVTSDGLEYGTYKYCFSAVLIGWAWREQQSGRCSGRQDAKVRILLWLAIALCNKHVTFLWCKLLWHYLLGKSSVIWQ